MTDKDNIETLFEIASTALPTIKNHLDVIVKTLADLIQFYKNEINPNLDFGEAYIEHYRLVIAGKFDKFTKEYKF